MTPKELTRDATAGFPLEPINTSSLLAVLNPKLAIPTLVLSSQRHDFLWPLKTVFAQGRTTSVEQINLSLFLASPGVTLTLPLAPMVSRDWSTGCLMLLLLLSALTQAKM